MGTLNINFEVIPSEFDENIEGKKYSQSLIEDLAYQKALDVAQKLKTPALIIGADTVVIVGDEILGKPKDRDDAFKMLKKISNVTHQVVTAIAIIDTDTNDTLVRATISDVTFKELNDKEINTYLDICKPYDKAGSYGIQEMSGSFVREIKGCYNNIVGMSTYTLTEMLKEFGVYIY